MTLPSYLPKSDQYGNFWLGTDHRVCPVVMHAGSEPHAPRNARGWFASRGGSDGVIFDGSCQRCRKFRPVFLNPVDKAPNGQLRFLCLECIGDLGKLETKPKVVEK